MDTVKNIDDEKSHEVEVESNAPFPWKKVLLAPFRILWNIIWFLIKAILRIAIFSFKVLWWFAKLILFFILILLGIFIVCIPSLSSFSTLDNNRREGEPEWMYQRRIKEERAQLRERTKSSSRRVFGAAGKVWKSLWGGSRSVDEVE